VKKFESGPFIDSKIICYLEIIKNFFLLIRAVVSKWSKVPALEQKSTVAVPMPTIFQHWIAIKSASHTKSE